MQTTLEETDKHTVKLTVEIPPDEVDKDLERAYRKIAQQVKIPGFRKGKVPKQVIDAQFGHEAVLGEFIEENQKRSGMTPATVYASDPIQIRVPTTSARPFRRKRQTR